MCSIFGINGLAIYTNCMNDMIISMLRVYNTEQVAGCNDCIDYDVQYRCDEYNRCNVNEMNNILVV